LFGDSALQLDAKQQIGKAFPVWLGFEAANGQNASARIHPVGLLLFGP
jgi:hypothetical protein